MSETFLDHPEQWTKKSNGDVIYMKGDSTFPNHTGMVTFDFAQEEVRNFWISECINATLSGYVDGCFSDRATGTPKGAS